MLPAFTADGLLPAGDHTLTLAELRSSFLVTGEGLGIANWNSGRRAQLVDGLEVLAQQLWQVGMGSIFIDGSFVEDKLSPGDIDGYYECPRFSSDLDEALWLQQLENDLNQFDPYRIWTFDPHNFHVDRRTGKPHMPMWFQYGVELFANTGRTAAVIRGQNLTFPELFRMQRNTFHPKGIIELRSA